MAGALTDLIDSLSRVADGDETWVRKARRDLLALKAVHRAATRHMEYLGAQPKGSFGGDVIEALARARATGKRGGGR